VIADKITVLLLTHDPQFHCSMQNEDEIVSMHEFATCEYQMVIATPRLCQDIAFVPRARKDIHRIQCDPIVSDSQYQEIEEAQPVVQEEVDVNEDVHVVVDTNIEKNADPSKGEDVKSNDESDTIQDGNEPVDEMMHGGYADDLESKIASLEKEMIHTLTQQFIDKNNENEDENKPKIHILNSELLHGETLKDFMSSKSLEQQLEEITKILMEKMSAGRPIENKQHQHTTRVQENLKAYKQKFEDDEENGDEKES
jgi:hypothetical protein